MESRNIFQHPAIRELQKAIMRECRLMQLGSVFTLFVGMFTLLLSFQKNVLLSIAGVTVLTIGINLVFRTFKIQSPSDHQIMKMLKEKPESIVWVYSIVTERLPFGFQIGQSGILYFKMEDGEEFSVSIPRRNLKLISKVLNRILPHAAFGYSNDRANLYAKDPNKLKRNLTEN